jgi:hypothetical protein
MAATVTTVGISRENPCVYFKPTAHTTSNKPAAMRISQAIAILCFEKIQG